MFLDLKVRGFDVGCCFLLVNILCLFQMPTVVPLCHSGSVSVMAVHRLYQDAPAGVEAQQICCGLFSSRVKKLSEATDSVDEKSHNSSHP